MWPICQFQYKIISVHFGVAYQGINTLISRELSEGQWHQVLTFESDTGIDIDLKLGLFNWYLTV